MVRLADQVGCAAGLLVATLGQRDPSLRHGSQPAVCRPWPPTGLRPITQRLTNVGVLQAEPRDGRRGKVVGEAAGPAARV